jgi:hypothetical protein
MITEFTDVLCVTFIFKASLRTSKEVYNVALCWDSFFLRASSIGRRLPLVKLPISSQEKESRRWVGGRVMGEEGSNKNKKKLREERDW